MRGIGMYRHRSDFDICHPKKYHPVQAWLPAAETSKALLLRCIWRDELDVRDAWLQLQTPRPNSSTLRGFCRHR